MATFGSSTVPSGPNILFNPMAAQAAAQNFQRNQLLMQQERQGVAANEMEYMARIAAGILDQSGGDEAKMAELYGPAVAEAQRYGFAKQAPAAFPGLAAIRRVASLGTSSKELLERSYNQSQKPTTPYTDTTAAPPGAAPPTPSAPGLRPFVHASLPQGVTPEEDQVVRTVWGEANGQPLAGQQAVAHVIRNRAKASGETTEQVIFRPHQFEPWNTGRRAELEGLDPNSPEYQRILQQVVRPVLSGQAQDPTGGATHFLNPRLVTARGDQIPGWASGGNRTTIGAHDFYYAPYGRAPVAATTAAPGGGRTVVASVPPQTATDGSTAPPAPTTAPPAATVPAQPPQTAQVPAQAPPGSTAPAVAPAAQQAPQAPQSTLPTLPAAPQPPQLNRQGFTPPQTVALERARRDPRVSGEALDKLEAQFRKDNTALVGKAFDDTMQLAAEIRQQQQLLDQRATTSAQEERAKQEMQLKLEKAKREVEEHLARLRTMNVPPGHQRDDQGVVQRMPGYRPSPPTDYRYKTAEGDEVEPIPGSPADPVVMAAKEQVPPKFTEAMLDNSASIRLIDKALERLNKYPDAVGVKGLTPNFLLQRTDPEGVELRADIADIGSRIFHDRSGASVTMAEAPRLKPFIPQNSDTAETVRKNLLRLREIHRETLEEHYRTFGPESGRRFRLPTVEEVLKAPAPAVTPDENKAPLKPGWKRLTP